MTRCLCKWRSRDLAVPATFDLDKINHSVPLRYGNGLAVPDALGLDGVNPIDFVNHVCFPPAFPLILSNGRKEYSIAYSLSRHNIGLSAPCQPLHMLLNKYWGTSFE